MRLNALPDTRSAPGSRRRGGGGLRSAASGFAPMARWLAAILACVALPLAAAPGLPTARDLAADAGRLGRDGRVLVVLYSQADCTWCDAARRYLVPMANDDHWRRRAGFRQVDLDADTALADFAGRPGTHREFARRQGIRLAPTVAIYDARGVQRGDRIVGMRTPDFYGQYLEQAIESAHETAQLKH